MAGFGLVPFKTPQALEALAYLLARPDLSQAAAMIVDWRRWRSHSRLVGVPPLLRHIDQVEAGEPVPAGPASDIRVQLFDLEAGPLRLRKLQEYIRGQLAGVLRLDPAAIDLETPIGSLGIDSLTAIELRNRCERGLGLQLSATMVWNYPTVAAMALYLAEKMGLALAVTPAATPSTPPAFDDDLAAFLNQAEALSEDDLRRLLDEGRSDD